MRVRALRSGQVRRGRVRPPEDPRRSTHRRHQGQDRRREMPTLMQHSIVDTKPKSSMYYK